MRRPTRSLRASRCSAFRSSPCRGGGVCAGSAVEPAGRPRRSRRELAGPVQIALPAATSCRGRPFGRRDRQGERHVQRAADVRAHGHLERARGREGLHPGVAGAASCGRRRAAAPGPSRRTDRLRRDPAVGLALEPRRSRDPARGDQGHDRAKPRGAVRPRLPARQAHPPPLAERLARLPPRRDPAAHLGDPGGRCVRDPRRPSPRLGRQGARRAQHPGDRRGLRKENVMSNTHVPTTPDPKRWKALALLCTAFFMVILGSAIRVVPSPSIDADLAFSAGNLQWVLSAYLLSFGGLLLLGGRASDLMGRRRMFILGTGLFALASLGAGLAGTTGALLTARVVQGVAAAIMTPTALSILMTTFEEGAERNKALGIWGSTGAIGGTAAWLIGGPITSGLGWEWIFFINVPVAAVVVALSPVLLSES